MITNETTARAMEIKLPGELRETPEFLPGIGRTRNPGFRSQAMAARELKRATVWVWW